MGAASGSGGARLCLCLWLCPATEDQPPWLTQSLLGALGWPCLSNLSKSRDLHREGAQGVISVLFLLIQLHAPELRLLLAVARASRTCHTLSRELRAVRAVWLCRSKKDFPSLRSTLEKGNFPELHGRARTRH